MKRLMRRGITALIHASRESASAAETSRISSRRSRSEVTQLLVEVGDVGLAAECSALPGQHQAHQARRQPPFEEQHKIEVRAFRLEWPGAIRPRPPYDDAVRICGGARQRRTVLAGECAEHPPLELELVVVQPNLADRSSVHTVGWPVIRAQSEQPSATLRNDAMRGPTERE